MTSSLVEWVWRTSYPRLTVFVLAGITLLAIGGTLYLVDTLSTLEFGNLVFRIGVVGYLLLAFGAAGYFATEVFKRGPSP